MIGTKNISAERVRERTSRMLVPALFTASESKSQTGKCCLHGDTEKPVLKKIYAFQKLSVLRHCKKKGIPITHSL
jgi:hypothetical protein